MKFLIGLAWKNLSRYRRRTLITAVAIAFGLMLYIFVDGWLKGAEIDSERNLVWYETSSARIMAADYWENIESMSLKRSIENPEKVVEQVEALGYSAAPRTVFSGEIIMLEDPFEQDGSMQIRVIAIDPARDDEVFRFRESVVEGRYLEADEEGVLLGSWLAEDIGAELGYPLTIVTRSRSGYYQTIDVEIVGIIDSPNPLVNRGSIFLPLATADFYLEMEGTVTEINIKFPERFNTKELAPEKTEELAASLGANATGLVFVPWNILAKDYVALAATKQGGSSVILFLVFIIAAVGISNTMLMAIFERTRELGMMRALGMKNSQIRNAFMLEAGGIGLLGSVVGVTLGVLLNWFMVEVGIDFSWITRQVDIGYRISGIMRATWNVQSIIVAFLAGIILSMLVALMPTRRALRMEITDCLRDV